MRFGIDIAQQRMEFDEVVDRARFGEEIGFDGAWGFDHFVPMYGEGPGNCFDGMTTLAALATATQRIRLGLLVTGATYRHPSVFANQAMTIDHASHGRLEIAIGAAWYESEHLQLGIDFPPRPGVSTGWRTPSRYLRGCLPAKSCPTRAGRSASITLRCGPCPSSAPGPRSGSVARAGRGPYLWRRDLPMCGMPVTARATWSCRLKWTGSPRVSGVTRVRSCGLRRSRCPSRWTSSGAISKSLSSAAWGTWYAAGPARDAARWSSSPARYCPRSATSSLRPHPRPWAYRGRRLGALGTRR